MGRKELPRAILAYQRADRQRPESEPLELGVNMKICVSICTMHIESRIKGEWYPSKAKYIFGSDMSEDTACSLAENRAKVKVMREKLPEKLTSKRNLSCDLTEVRNSCKVIYMNVEMPVVGTQRVKLKTCEE